MPHDVTMPQLGMVQDTGIIVSWLKQPGDVVKVGDILMEVETDKATMEVEATQQGYLAAIFAQAGVPVPVGSVVATLVDTPEEAKAAPSVDGGKSASPITPVTAEPNPDAAEKQTQTAKPSAGPERQSPHPSPAVSAARAPTVDGRILASAKARHQAHVRGIDLARLVKQGLAQPFHVADLDRVAPLQAEGSAVDVLEARAPRTEFVNFAAWAAGHTGGDVTTGRIWASFVAGAWREASDEEAGSQIVIDYRAPTKRKKQITVDADLAGLASITEASGAEVADIAVVDLTATTLTSFRPEIAQGPSLVILDDNDAYRFVLFRPTGAVGSDLAAAFLDNVARRVADPLRNLL